MVSRITLTDRQLLDYSGEHLLYELQIFQWIVNNFPTEASFQRSVFVESFAVHLRNLIDFFYTSPLKAQGDDIVAGDFFNSPGEWNPGTIPTTLDSARQRANKEVSHITYKRKSANDTTKPWPVSDLFSEVNAVSRQFAAEASRNKLHTSVVQFLTATKDTAIGFLKSASTLSSNSTVIDQAVLSTKLRSDR